jgi:hypothetical protein
MDGVAAAIYGVLLTLVVADLAKGTGRFNFMQGAVQPAMGFGVACQLRRGASSPMPLLDG